MLVAGPGTDQPRLPDGRISYEDTLYQLLVWLFVVHSSIPGGRMLVAVFEGAVLFLVVLAAQSFERSTVDEYVLISWNRCPGFGVPGCLRNGCRLMLLLLLQLISCRSFSTSKHGRHQTSDSNNNGRKFTYYTLLSAFLQPQRFSLPRCKHGTNCFTEQNQTKHHRQNLEHLFPPDFAQRTVDALVAARTHSTHMYT